MKIKRLVCYKIVVDGWDKHRTDGLQEIERLIKAAVRDGAKPAAWVLIFYSKIYQQSKEDQLEHYKDLYPNAIPGNKKVYDNFHKAIFTLKSGLRNWLSAHYKTKEGKRAKYRIELIPRRGCPPLLGLKILSEVTPEKNSKQKLSDKQKFVKQDFADKYRYELYSLIFGKLGDNYNLNKECIIELDKLGKKIEANLHELTDLPSEQFRTFVADMESKKDQGMKPTIEEILKLHYFRKSGNQIKEILRLGLIPMKAISSLRKKLSESVNQIGELSENLEKLIGMERDFKTIDLGEDTKFLVEANSPLADEENFWKFLVECANEAELEVEFPLSLSTEQQAGQTGGTDTFSASQSDHKHQGTATE